MIWFVGCSLDFFLFFKLLLLLSFNSCIILIAYKSLFKCRYFTHMFVPKKSPKIFASFDCCFSYFFHIADLLFCEFRDGEPWFGSEFDSCIIYLKSFVEWSWSIIIYVTECRFTIAANYSMIGLLILYRWILKCTTIVWSC